MTTATLHSATPLSHLALFLSFSARLSERQRAALTELAAGRPILAAAAAAGVHRSTLHRWLSHCEDFQAAYAALCRRQSEADSDLAALARASLQALITDPATPAELRLRAIQTALKLVQSRPATPLLPALERPLDAPLPPPAESPQPTVQTPPPPSPGSSEPTISAAERAELLATLHAARERLALLPPGSPAVAPPGRGSSQSAGGRAEEGTADPLPSAPPPPPPPAQALLESPAAQAPKPEATPVALATVARNAPCPCGSKLKFKRCCGINAPPVLHAATP